MLYKQQQIIKKIPTCSYLISDLDSLVNLCLRIHEECHEKMIQDIEEQRYVLDKIDYRNRDDVKNHVLNNLLWTVEIYGANGEYLFIQDLKKLSPSDMPLKIKRFKFGNSFSYEFVCKRKPSIYFDITIDFKETKIFDLVSVPTYSTDNDSIYDVSGINYTMVSGISSQLENYFNKQKNFNGLINAQNAYDVLLWLGFFPFSAILLLKYESKIPLTITNSPVFVQSLFSILCFFLCLYLFRCIFNLARWFFPCQELVSQVSKERQLLRILFSIAIAGVLGTIGYNVFDWFLQKIIS